MTITDTKLKSLREKIKQKNFQINRGLSNEVSYYILDYDPKETLKVQEEIAHMKQELTAVTVGVDIVEFDIYDIMWTLIDELGIKADVLEMEATEGIGYLSEQLNNVLDMTESNNKFVAYMNARLTQENVVVFVTGIGKIFPLFRAHKILNTMHQIITDVPVVLFYPGRYNSLNLSMFGEMKEDNYYRAFQIN